MDAEDMFESVLQEALRKAEMTVRQAVIIEDLRKENVRIQTALEIASDDVVKLTNRLSASANDNEALRSQLVENKAADIKLTSAVAR